MLERLIAKYGILPLAVAGFVLFVVLLFSGIAGINKIKSAWHERQAEKQEAIAQQAKADAKAVKADLKQTDKAGEIAADTVTKQDQTATGQRQNTAKAIGKINERIIEVPVAVPVADDPIVRDQVHQARLSAIAAQDRLQRTPGN
jgi:cytoskeletal protein RodZ